MSLKQHLGGLILYNNKEVEKSVREYVRMQKPTYAAKEQLNPRHDGTNTYWCIAIRLPTDATLYFVYIFPFLPYMFRALISPSSGVSQAVLQ